MRKTFELSHPKIKVARLADAARHDVKKYVKRERKKALPADADYWDFDCKFGPSADEAKDVHLAEIAKCIDEAERAELPAFYVEIHARPAKRTRNPE